VVIELVALLLVSDAVERRDECVDAKRVVGVVTHSEILHHLTLARLDGGADEDAAALCRIQEGEDLGLEEGGQEGAVGLKDGDRPAVDVVLGGDGGHS